MISDKIKKVCAEFGFRVVVDDVETCAFEGFTSRGRYGVGFTAGTSDDVIIAELDRARSREWLRFLESA